MENLHHLQDIMIQAFCWKQGKVDVENGPIPLHYYVEQWVGMPVLLFVKVIMFGLRYLQCSRQNYFLRNNNLKILHLVPLNLKIKICKRMQEI